MWYLTDHSKTVLPVLEIAAILNCPLTPEGNMRRPSEALLG
jgi:hypothetical protein